MATAPAPAPFPTEKLIFDDDELRRWSTTDEAQPILTNINREFRDVCDRRRVLFVNMKLRAHLNSLTVEEQQEVKSHLRMSLDDVTKLLGGAKKPRKSKTRKRKPRKSRKTKRR